VFDVLADGWLYVAWVVGAARCRDVDKEWPAEGSRIHHSFGVWPVLLNDATVSLGWDAPRKASFRARGWPIGEAQVIIEVQPSGDGCTVRITEFPIKGPGTLVGPLLEPLIALRNIETLRRLREIAEGRIRTGETTTA
jgi:hypothetical protein